MSDEIAIKEMAALPQPDLLAWAVMNMIVEFGGDKFLEVFSIDATNHENRVVVDLKINGVEVSPRQVFAELNRQLDELIRREAMRLIQEKCCESSAAMKLVDEIGEFAKRRASESLGVGWQDRW